MTQVDLHKLIKTSGKYDLSVFNKESIDELEKSIYEKNGKLYFDCLVRKKAIQVKAEEIVRQLMIDKLLSEYNYPVEH